MLFIIFPPDLNFQYILSVRKVVKIKLFPPLWICTLTQGLGKHKSDQDLSFLQKMAAFKKCTPQKKREADFKNKYEKGTAVFCNPAGKWGGTLFYTTCGRI